jgi:WD repeat-containing protein 68
VGSFLEDRCSNKVAVVDFDANRGEFTVRAEFMHGYAATKLMWRPEDLTGDAADLLATSGDYLRLWHVPNDGVQVRPHAVLYDPLELDWRVRGAVTSFDWSAVEANLIATAHFNGTMNLWDISVWPYS